MTLYKSAPAVLKIARDLIRKVPEHKQMAGVPLACVFRPEPTRKGGKVVLATARVVGGLNAFLIHDAAAGGEDGQIAVVEVAEKTWDRLTEAQRQALVDHELCHFTVEPSDEGPPILKLKGHDLEEFAGVIERHGFWRADVAAFSATIAEQLSLAVMEAEAFNEKLVTEEELGDDPDA